MGNSQQKSGREKGGFIRTANYIILAIIPALGLSLLVYGMAINKSKNSLASGVKSSTSTSVPFATVSGCHNPIPMMCPRAESTSTIGPLPPPPPMAPQPTIEGPDGPIGVTGLNANCQVGYQMWLKTSGYGYPVALPSAENKNGVELTFQNTDAGGSYVCVLSVMNQNGFGYPVTTLEPLNSNQGIMAVGSCPLGNPSSQYPQGTVSDNCPDMHMTYTFSFDPVAGGPLAITGWSGTTIDIVNSLGDKYTVNLLDPGRYLVPVS
jgi:hypothetical protein